MIATDLPGLGQQVARGQPRRAGADDRHVDRDFAPLRRFRKAHSRPRGPMGRE